MDLLLSMRHQPNVVINDMANIDAAHGNIRRPGMFGLLEGQLVPATAANIQAAQNGQLRIEMPWLLDYYNEQAVVISGAIADHLYHTAVHPLTGTIKCSLFNEHLIIAVCKYMSIPIQVHHTTTASSMSSMRGTHTKKD